MRRPAATTSSISSIWPKRRGLTTAERFLDQAEAEASFKQLAEHPKMGSPLTVRPPQLAGLRKWRKLLSEFRPTRTSLR